MPEPVMQFLLFQILFGDSAAAARQGASRRLRRWAGAFEAWLEDIRLHRTSSTCKHALNAWRRLLEQQPKMPWELTSADISNHAAWLKTEGYAPSTISSSLGSLHGFYRWCSERKIDPSSSPGFNPAAGVPRPRIVPYAGGTLLSRGEITALLDLLRRDRTPLGQRDYALILSRLSLGVPLRLLQRLQWGQVEQVDGAAWVRWRPASAPSRLPGDVWQALLAWLAASGRLAAIRPESYLFVPLRDPLHEGPQDTPLAWDERSFLSRNRILVNLKRYGLQAGVSAGKLTLMALRRTAARLKLDRADDPPEILSFLETHEQAKAINFRLKHLPPLPQDEPRPGPSAGPGPPLPDRTPVRFPPGHGLTHGFYARSQPPGAVAEILEDDVHGLEEEIVGLRTLARSLLGLQEQAESSDEAARLADAYSKAASRLADLIQAEMHLAEKPPGGAWADEFLKKWDRFLVDQGEPPIGDALRAGALGSDPTLAVSDRRLVEEIASLRCVLRRTQELARQETGARQLITLADIYGQGCIRLVRLLRANVADSGRLEALINRALDEALAEVMQELGIGKSL